MSKLIQRKAAEQAESIRVKEQEVVSTSTESKKRKIVQEVNDTKSPKAAKKGKKKAVDPNEKSSVIYIGHLPHGFYEPQLKKFFMQFGIVRKCKLFRSAKTGGSKGFAFLQFESAETAQTVSDAMQGYFLHDRQLVSHVVPTSKHHDGMWKMRKPTEEMVEEAKKNEEKIEKNVDSAKSKEDLLRRLTEKQNKLNEMGIDFQIPGLSC